MAEGISAGVAYIDIVPNMKKFSSQVGGRVKSATSKLAGIGHTLGGQLGVSIGAAAAVELGKHSFEAYEALEKSQQRFEFGLKQIGRTKSMDDILDWATQFSESTAINKQQIVDMGSKLVIYGRQFLSTLGAGAAKDDIEKLTSGMINLGAATGKSGSLLLRSLGPGILNAPAVAASQLLKYGALTEKQVTHIKNLVAAGKTQAATQMEINALSGKFAGIAAAQATPLDKLKNLFNLLQLFIGKYVTKAVNGLINLGYKLVAYFKSAAGPAKAFRQVLSEIRDQINRLIAYIQKNPEAFKDFAIGIGIVTAALIALSVAAVIVEVVTSPITVIILTLGALVGAFIYFYKTNQGFANFVNAAWAEIKKVVPPIIDALKKAVEIAIGAVENFIKTNQTFRSIVSQVWHDTQKVVLGAINLIGNHMNVLKAIFKAVTAVVRAQIKIALSVIKSMAKIIGDDINLVGDVLHGRWGKIWGDIKQTVVDTISGIKNVLKTAASALGGILSDIVKAPVNAIIDQINGLSFPSVKNPITGHTLVGGGHPFDIGHLAQGGLAQRGRPYWVGDGGQPELFVPDVRGHVIPRSKLGSMTGGGGGGSVGVLTITNWEKGTGYFRTLARDEADKDATYQATRGRMAR